MSGRVSLFQSFAGDVRVNLGRADAGVSEDFLHTAQIGAAIEKVGGGGVPQDVWAFRAVAGHRTDDCCDNPVHGSGRERLPSRADKQVIDIGVRDESWSCVVAIREKCVPGGDTKRNDAFLCTLTENANGRVGPVDFVQVNPD